jgi:hypothetical protein
MSSFTLAAARAALLHPEYGWKTTVRRRAAPQRAAAGPASATAHRGRGPRLRAAVGEDRRLTARMRTALECRAALLGPW